MLTTIGWQRLAWIPALPLLMLHASCRKPADAEKSALKQAGYSLAVGDWMRAAAQDDAPALQKFIAAGFDATATDDKGDTALHAAAATGAERSASLLLNHGIGVNTPGGGGRTPLMAAVTGQRRAMTGWLLRQGADVHIKDHDGYNALMLAVREDSTEALAEIAPYHSGNLDAALLLAALTGRTSAIDTLTSYGASVYARMDDGRTPLMLAAENGHAETVMLLLDLGASRYSVDQDGRTAAGLAMQSGHVEIAAMIMRPPQPDDFSLESPEQISKMMDHFVEQARGRSAASEGEIPAGGAGTSITRPAPGAASAGGLPSAEVPGQPVAGNPPIIMRHYRERELPVEVRSVSNDSAAIAILGGDTREVVVRPGDKIPGSSLVVLRVRQRVTDSKLNLGRPGEISVVEVQDPATGISRQWITGLPASAHDPVALVEDTSTGSRHTVASGQRFRSSDGTEFIVADVRPNQIVIENTTTGEVQTIGLSGPRG
jgi:ankyrin repeat protein